MRILLMGGTGAMGIHLSSLLQGEHEVFVTTRRQVTGDSRVHYLQGDAKDLSFLSNILKDGWDVIVDFMVYSTKEFEHRVGKLLQATKQYVFLSSARVFADAGKSLITEDSRRLLDVCNDKEYLATDEYALTKARQEDILVASKNENWTIVRPYITYSENRLQLGVLEKEEWLYRSLLGRSIVFSEELMHKETTLTYGFDVARAMVRLLGSSQALRQSFNITSGYTTTWGQVLDVYSQKIQSYTGNAPKIVLLPFEDFLKTKPYCKYQLVYDRYYNRKFDTTKIERVAGVIDWRKPLDGVEACFDQFVKSKAFLQIDWRAEAVRDKFSGQFTMPWEVRGLRNKLGYLKSRFN